jgi:NAD(P)-dependent dehydrogenase (short-subunit alcohol dehydrogenase family)
MTPRRLYILTGASRGLGAAMAEQLLAPDVHLLTMARHPDPALADRALAAGTALEQWAIDLGDGASAAARLETRLHQQAAADFSAATLINNAGLLGRVGPIERADADQLSAVLRVGLEAPLLLSATFLRATRAWAIDKRVLNISSGAGRRPIAGWSVLRREMDSITIGAVRSTKLSAHRRASRHGARVIDTDMQGELRASAGLRSVPFRRPKTSGQLPTPKPPSAFLAYLAPFWNPAGRRWRDVGLMNDDRRAGRRTRYRQAPPAAARAADGVSND